MSFHDSPAVNTLRTLQIPSSCTWISHSHRRLHTTSSRAPVFRVNNDMRAK